MSLQDPTAKPSQVLGSFRSGRLGSLLAGRRGASVGSQGNPVSTPGSFLPDQSRNSQISLNAQEGHVNAMNRIDSQRERQRAAQQQQPVSVAGAPQGGRVSVAPQGGSGQGHGGAFGLTPQAGAYLQALRGAYQKQFGQALPVNSGGRTYAEQQHLYNLYRQGRGNLAARPGTSTHESGRAVDFGGQAHYEGTPQHNWLVANAGRYGFSWTGKNFSQREAWHFDYVW